MSLLLESPREYQQLLNKEISHYLIQQNIGKGAFATVFQARDIKNNVKVAIKTISKQLISSDQNIQRLLNSQLRILQLCNNENVIKFVDKITTSSDIFIVLQYCNGGNLQDYLMKKQGHKITQSQAKAFLKQILNGFKGLHQQNVIHRDVKLANVLLHNGICKIGDLGFAKQIIMGQLANSILGTSITMAPQVCAKKPYDLKADIWSLGIIFFFMLFGRYPFMVASSTFLYDNNFDNIINFEGANISSEAKNFIQRCLIVNQKQRISWKDIYSHPLINKQNVKESFYDSQVVSQQKNFSNEQQSLKRYFSTYQTQKENILFFHKFVFPCFQNVLQLSAPHQKIYYLTLKKTISDMKKFFENLLNKNNTYSQQYYYKKFIQSKIFKSLLFQTKNQIASMQIKMTVLKEQLLDSNDEIQLQIECFEKHTNNYKEFLKKSLQQYEQLLIQHIDQISAQFKNSLLTLIFSIRQYRVCQSVNSLNYSQKLKTISLKKLEQELQSNKLKQYQ